MKENISIIFAAIIGTFLIVILPLYSILDRQDSMSYNVVLTATTNFVDNVRNKGFIDKESYTEYIRKISTTGNTYKVKIQAYKNVLIPETDENGDIIPNSFVEEKELYNTQDIVKVLEDEDIINENIATSSKKNNTYLFNENDEIYITVYNTNITAGSIIYGMIADVTNNKVIDISYGGVINKINWELYDKVQSDTTLAPEVVLSVPVNKNNSTNVQKLGVENNTEYIDCTTLFLENYEGDLSIEELCADYALDEGQNYTYLYDLSKPENKKIKVAVELRRFEKISVGIEEVRNPATGIDEVKEIFVPLSELEFTDDVKQHIIKNYIRLNGMEASIDLKLREDGDYYVFDIQLDDVRMSILDFISTRASIEILPGLGQDENETLSLGGTSVEIELLDATIVNTVVISEPYIWQKLLRTKSFSESKIMDSIVYAKVDIAFVISYTGITKPTDAEIKNAIKNNLDIFISDATYTGLEFYTAQELNKKHGLNIATETAGHVLVKFSYTAANSSNENYIRLRTNWINTGEDIIIDPETGEETTAKAEGAVSKTYQVLLDDVAPYAPTVTLSGKLGENDWYTSDVTVNLIKSENDKILKNGTEQVGGSGVLKSTVTITGAAKQAETESTSVVLTANGKSYVTPKAYDYAGNVVTGAKKTVKIDKEDPTAPKITLTGDKVNDNWYMSNVKIQITPGTDDISGVVRTTYTIDGANALAETEGTIYTLTKNGTSTIVATTYDEAGNKSRTELKVNIDKTVPKDAEFEIISGDKSSSDNEWYTSDVKVRIKVDVGKSISGLGKSSYEITGDGNNVSATYFEGNTKDITLNTNGTHVITVNTYTQAGRNKTTTYTVKIDKDAPKAPALNVVSGTQGDDEWYKTNVEVQIVPQGDIGTSNETAQKAYTITQNGTTSSRVSINNNGKVAFNQEGKYLLTVYAWDMAGNEVTAEKTIKIDKEVNVPAEFVITGDTGNEGWYIGNVTISHTGGSDNVSGIKEVILSHESITKNTNGTTVTLTTKDNAGNTVTKEVTIKLDKNKPDSPTIELLDTPTGTGISEWNLYNKDVNIKILPGKDTFVSGVDNYDKTVYRLFTSDTGYTEPVVVEKNGTTIKVTQEGRITVIVDTYDKAGNVSSKTVSLWIDKSDAKVPEIESINGEQVSNVSTKEVAGTTNIISLDLNNIESTNNLKEINITLTNQETLDTITITKQTSAMPIKISLKEKGTYRIEVNQTNKFGTVSESNNGLYYYKYE